jgi:hypothetical protein
MTNWKEKFKKILPVADMDIRNGVWLIEQKEAEKFIENLIKEQEKEIKANLIERVRELIFVKRADGSWVRKNGTASADLHRYTRGINDTVEDIIKIIEE